MAPHVIRWGIISTGGISTTFVKDLLTDPSTRGVSDVVHKITAIGSRSQETADEFIDKINNAKSDDFWHSGLKAGHFKDVKGYPDYHQVYNDPNVDVVYIGTPHNFHHLNSKGALLAGKHVLCEKAFTFDLEELDELIKIAREKKLFLMEAVWTRFQPIAYEVEELLFSGKLGKVLRFSADFSSAFDPDSMPLSHRIINPDLAGGGLLDMGPYPSVWAMLLLHRHPDNKNRKAPKLINSHQSIYQRTKVDERSRWLLDWEDVSEAALMSDINCDGHVEAHVLVQCEKADLTIEWNIPVPKYYNVVPKPPGRESYVKTKERHHVPVPSGVGMMYEADEVARCIRDGKLESERMPLEESRIVQSWFDDVRKAGNSILKDKKGTAGQDA